MEGLIRKVFKKSRDDMNEIFIDLRIICHVPIYENKSKGILMNAGFTEAMKIKNFDCVVFHDVDMLPQEGLLRA